MPPEQNSISIINRSNSSVTGENSNALPIKIVTSVSGFKAFVVGFAIAIVSLVVMIISVNQQVVTVETIGKSPNYKEYELK